MQLCAAKGKKIAGSGCFKIYRNAGLTSPEENNSAHISNKMVYVCFLWVQLESLCRCGEYTSFSRCIFFGIEVHLEQVGSGREARNSRQF